ncbi:hypothetical protein FND50_18765 [Rhodococcus sp. WB9]|uniref:hypothetical protein n=1 Tax=Rhodococcus sp. WB9 TaxID=2594007 RepID=UPI00118496E7|nr:hypothetical protein [Rhodococcus sp. WB9]QDQ92635.1 hypothetical protein FND50_18765 [Rhodococcus sp. WB9]
MTQWELVRVDHHQFALGEPGAETLNPVDEGTLIEVGAGFVSFFTGITYGPARLALDLLEHAPETEGTQEWEVIEEAAITTTSDIVVTTLDGTESTTLTPVPAGRYTVRAHARGRDTRYGEDVTEPCEDYLVQLWPTHTADNSVHTLHKTDRAWSLQTQVDESSLSRDYVYIRNDSGDVVKVPPKGPEANAVRAHLNEFGGTPLTPTLEAVFSSRYVAGLDRPLIDRIDAATPDRQRAFARWCVHRAFERAGIADIDWLRDVLTEMDAGKPVNEDFIASFAARNRLDQDPRITRRIVSGLPASRELVQQYEALRAYSRSMYPEATPLESAIEAFWHAAKTYGMDYPELIDAARQDFFGKE